MSGRQKAERRRRKAEASGRGGSETQGGGGRARRGAEPRGGPRGAGRPSYELRGINGRQLARLSAVFLAVPAEACNLSAQAQVPARRRGRGTRPGRGGRTLDSGSPDGLRSRRRGPGGGWGRTGPRPAPGGCRETRRRERGRAARGTPGGAQARGPARAHSEPPSALFCSSPDTGRISTAAQSQPLRIAKKGRKICGIN